MGFHHCKPHLEELPRFSDRITFLYLENSEIRRTDSGLVAHSKNGYINVPISSISTMLLGPGTSVTHGAMELISESGSSISWVSKGGIKCYAFGSPLTKSSRMIVSQAEKVSNIRKRLSVARKMYQMRFPDEDVSKLTMQQLRGREGSRIKSVYRRESIRTGVPWNGRMYAPNKIEFSDDVNSSLSIANACLYGLAYAAICALGCSPSLGFVHQGHQNAFVHDIADLYKADTSIPVAFDVVASRTASIWQDTRRLMRDRFKTKNLLETMVKDIYSLILDDEADNPFSDVVQLWDETQGSVPSGVQYGKGVDNS